MIVPSAVVIRTQDAIDATPQAFVARAVISARLASSAGRLAAVVPVALRIVAAAVLGVISALEVRIAPPVGSAGLPLTADVEAASVVALDGIVGTVSRVADTLEARIAPPVRVTRQPLTANVEAALAVALDGIVLAVGVVDDTVQAFVTGPATRAGLRSSANSHAADVLGVVAADHAVVSAFEPTLAAVLRIAGRGFSADRNAHAVDTGEALVAPAERAGFALVPSW